MNKQTNINIRTDVDVKNKAEFFIKKHSMLMNLPFNKAYTGFLIGCNSTTIAKEFGINEMTFNFPEINN